VYYWLSLNSLTKGLKAAFGVMKSYIECMSLGERTI